MGLALLFIMPEEPHRTKMLNEEERALAVARLNADAIVKTDGKKEKTTLKLILRSFNLWVGTLVVTSFPYLIHSPRPSYVPWGTFSSTFLSRDLVCSCQPSSVLVRVLCRVFFLSYLIMYIISTLTVGKFSTST